MKTDLDLDDRVRARIRASIEKYQSWDMTEDEIRHRINERINEMSNVELLGCIAVELTEMENGL